MVLKCKWVNLLKSAKREIISIAPICQFLSFFLSFFFMKKHHLNTNSLRLSGKSPLPWPQRRLISTLPIPPSPSRHLSSISDFFFWNLQFALSLWPANSSKTHPCLRKCVQLPHPWGKRERFIPLNSEKIKIWKNLEKNKILSNLKVTVLEQVNQGLHPGKVWENRIFLHFIGIVDIRKPILRFHWDQHRKRRKSRCRVLGHPDLIEHINVAHKCDWFLVKLLRTPTSRFVASGPCSNLIVLPCRSATYLRICRYRRTPLPSWHGKLEPSLQE